MCSGWPDRIGEALPRRGDLDVLVVDALGEGSGFVRRLLHADMDVVDVPMSGLGAAVADADLVLLEASAIGPDGFVAVAGSRAAASVAAHDADSRLVGDRHRARALPRRMWDALAGARSTPKATRGTSTTRSSRSTSSTWSLDRSATRSVEEAAKHIDCPIAPELFKSVGRL